MMRIDSELHFKENGQSPESFSAGVPGEGLGPGKTHLELPAHRRLRILLLAYGFPIQYRALRTATDAGADVFVLGAREAKSLRLSRYCRAFRLLKEDAGGDAKANHSLLTDQIRQGCADWQIDLILAGDRWAVELLGKLGAIFPVAVFPMPEPEQFQVLDNKWRFYQICKRLEIPVPQSWYFESKEALFQAAAAGELPEKLIAKPLQMYGEIGIQRFSARAAERDLAQLDYAPFLVQEFVAGADTNCVLVVLEGRVLARLSYVEHLTEKQFGCDEEILGHVERLARELNLSGIYNFDTRRTESGRVYFFECNPRPFLSMHMVAQAGINCISVMLQALAGKQAPVANMQRCTIGRWRGLLRMMAAPWRASAQNRQAILDCIQDPLPLWPQIVDFIKGKISGKIAWVR